MLRSYQEKGVSKKTQTKEAFANNIFSQCQIEAIVCDKTEPKFWILQDWKISNTVDFGAISGLIKIRHEEKVCPDVVSMVFNPKITR